MKVLLEALTPKEARGWLAAVTAHWRYVNDQMLWRRIKQVENAPPEGRQLALVSQKLFG